MPAETEAVCPGTTFISLPSSPRETPTTPSVTLTEAPSPSTVTSNSVPLTVATRNGVFTLNFRSGFLSTRKRRVPIELMIRVSPFCAGIAGISISVFSATIIKSAPRSSITTPEEPDINSVSGSRISPTESGCQDLVPRRHNAVSPEIATAAQRFSKPERFAPETPSTRGGVFTSADGLSSLISQPTKAETTIAATATEHRPDFRNLSLAFAPTDFFKATFPFVSSMGSVPPYPNRNCTIRRHNTPNIKPRRTSVSNRKLFSFQ